MKRFTEKHPASRLSISGHTGLTALLGSPVAHSLSPAMHNTAFSMLGLDYVYLCFDVDEAQLPAAVEGLKTCGIRGFNLTMPDKNKMVELVDALSPAASMIGAVNTVVNENGRLTGHNTDGVGYMRSIEDAGFSVIGKTMTILGSGGASTAICTQAALDGVCELNIFARPTSRFHARTVKLVDEINRRTACHASLYDLADKSALNDSICRSALLTNATSVGMAPNEEASLIEDFSIYPSSLAVSDIIYNPRETRFLRLAREAGLATCNGLYMLLYQGAEAFRLWTGCEMPTEEIKRLYF